MTPKLPSMSARPLGILASLSTVLLASSALAEMSTAVRQSTHEVSGLQQAAELIVDQWGIPHIYAGSTRDAIFLQGYNAARDRLWQIDLWRKRGLGLLAKDFGPTYVAQDRATRMFLYRGDMAKEWAAYGPDAKSYTEAFAAGITPMSTRCGTVAGRSPSSSRSPEPCPTAGALKTSCASAATG